MIVLALFGVILGAIAGLCLSLLVGFAVIGWYNSRHP